MRGIIMASGSGTRLHPLTLTVSKQLLPVYNKPMIYYPLSTLMLAGVREILMISSARDLPLFRALFEDGSHLGLRIEYQIQNEPNGIAHGLLLAEDFLEASAACLALGDNIFYGAGVGESLAQYKTTSGATILAQRVSDPHRYGIVEFDSTGQAVSLEEKPSQPRSNYAVPGLYFYDESAPERVKHLTPSARGELEITDLNLSYMRDGLLQVATLPRGTAWLDTGTVDSLFQASEFVKVVEQRQGSKIACPEEIAWRMGYITDNDFELLLHRAYSPEYGKYLRDLRN